MTLLLKLHVGNLNLFLQRNSFANIKMEPKTYYYATDFEKDHQDCGKADSHLSSECSTEHGREPIFQMKHGELLYYKINTLH